MTTNRIFRAYLNPLAFLKVDEPWASHTDDSDLNLEDILRFMCTPGTTSDLLSLVARYREISAETKRLSVAPEEPNIFEKLVWPLRHAKASYMVGNYLGTISLCGMVAEMSAILIFEIADISINAQPLNKKLRKRYLAVLSRI